MTMAAPYGTWSSVVTAEAITEGTTRFTDILVDPITSTIYHLESRPSEEGRSVIVDTLAKVDVVGPGWNVRTAVQEYGGAAAIVYDRTTYFSHFKDNRVYRARIGGEPEAITPENALHRFAGFDVHPKQSHLLVSILEDHTIDLPSRVITTLVVINTETRSVHPLVSGADFYASPKFSPNGDRITWLQWSHPDMPWEGSEIHVADVVLGSDGKLSVKGDILVAGEKSNISAAFPLWATNDTLLFTSNESGYINPWKYANGSCEALFSQPVSIEFGIPLWQFQESPSVVIDEAGRFALFSGIKDGQSSLYLIDLLSKSEPSSLDSSYVTVDFLRCASRKDHLVLFVGQKVDEGSSIIQCTITDFSGYSPPTYSILRSARSPPFPKEFISIPMPMSLQSSSGNEIHVIYYAPRNPNYFGTNIPGERPPCVLNVHGGPTGQSMQGLNWKIQYFTSRGWAWLDVNYGGSSGYGCQYINRLVGKWGVVDVQDCIEASQLLSNGPENLVDPKRVVIRGGSSGGFTVLAALANGQDATTFAAGTSSYGICDLKMLAQDTHKFESHYLFKLIGGEPDEIPAVYEARSPIYHAGNIVSPLLILQGEIDKVVPKEQAELMYRTVKNQGRVVEYVLYPGEGHGWRQSKTMKDALEKELQFYEDVFRQKKLLPPV